jgi:hypothetical protein
VFGAERPSHRRHGNEAGEHGVSRDARRYVRHAPEQGRTTDVSSLDPRGPDRCSTASCSCRFVMAQEDPRVAPIEVEQANPTNIATELHLVALRRRTLLVIVPTSNALPNLPHALRHNTEWVRQTPGG